MDTTILFPTDFTVNSLRLVKKAIEDHPEGKLDILLIHGIHCSDSITDLLFFSKGKIIEKLSNPEFEEACEQLRTVFGSRLNSLETELFTGFTQSAFNNFLEALKVDKIYFPAPFKVTFSNRMSADITRFLEKSGIPKVVVTMDGKAAEVDASHKIISRISFTK